MVADFLLSYAKLLVENPEDISVKHVQADRETDEITIFAQREDIGKLIGKEGKMINAMKTVVSACKAKGGKNYRIHVKEVS